MSIDSGRTLVYKVRRLLAVLPAWSTGLLSFAVYC